MQIIQHFMNFLPDFDQYATNILSVFDQFSTSIWSIFGQHLINIYVNPQLHPLKFTVISFEFLLKNYTPTFPRSIFLVISFEFLLKNCKLSNILSIFYHILTNISPSPPYFAVIISNFCKTNANYFTFDEFFSRFWPVCDQYFHI